MTKKVPAVSAGTFSFGRQRANQAADIKRLIRYSWLDAGAEFALDRAVFWLTFGVNTAEIG
jgi:hypothetical protein